MPTKFPELFADLAAPFVEPDQVKARQQAGRQLHYITARTAMNRLDDVLGPENWWDEYEAHEHSVLCKLTICLPDGSTLTKQDAGGYAGMSDQGDDDKSGYSDAFKRAAAKFGVARYLYRDGVPEFVRQHVGGAEPVAHRASAPPQRPNGHPAPPRPAPAPPRQQQHSDNGSAPRSGRALFAWTKKQEEEHQVSLLNWLNAYIKEQHGGKRMVDLDEREVADVYAEATRRLDELHGGTVEDQSQEAAPDGDIPFDRAAAWAHLLNVAEDLAGHLFSDYRGTDAEMQSALASLDPLIPDHLRVRDWDQCHNRDSFLAYYREAVASVREYQTGQVPD